MAWAPPAWATMPARATVCLQVLRGEELVKTHDLTKRKSFVLGRQAGIADLLVEDEHVSRQHAALVHKEAVIYLIDLRSAGGTTVDGARAKPLNATALKEGSLIRLGEAPLRYVIKGLGAPTLPATPAAPPSWTAPSWAVAPSSLVAMYLQENGKNVQSLDLSRHPSYVLGRSAASAKIVVPHDSVSRQHAAIVHAAQGPGGAPSVHVIDLGSAKGTFMDLGQGWVRLPPNLPTLLPPGSRVRLADCETRIAYPPVLPPSAAALPLAPAGPQPTGPQPADDAAPRFSSLLSSTIIKANDSSPEARSGGEGAGDAAAESDCGADADGHNDSDVTGAIGPAMPAAPKLLKNADFRAAMLPFLSKPAAEEPSYTYAEGGSGKAGKGKKGKKRRANEDSDSEGEAQAPVVLDKSEPAGAGLVLRKTKAQPEKKKKSGPIIKF